MASPTTTARCVRTTDAFADPDTFDVRAAGRIIGQIYRTDPGEGRRGWLAFHRVGPEAEPTYLGLFNTRPAARDGVALAEDDHVAGREPQHRGR